MSFFDAIMSFFGGKGIPQGCKFTLSCAGQNIILPVTPASFKVGRTYNNSTLNINAIGEINMLGKRGLQTLSFEGFFPAQKYEWSETNETNPYNLVGKLMDLLQVVNLVRFQFPIHQFLCIVQLSHLIMMSMMVQVMYIMR